MNITHHTTVGVHNEYKKLSHFLYSLCAPECSYTKCKLKVMGYLYTTHYFIHKTGEVSDSRLSDVFTKCICIHYKQPVSWALEC